MRHSSEYGFAYILHLNAGAYQELRNGKTPTKLNFVEEREGLQIVTAKGWSTRVYEAATVVFELWTGRVFKSRHTTSSDLEVILAADDTLSALDTSRLFGALRYQVICCLGYKWEKCERLYQFCRAKGYLLRDIPKAAGIDLNTASPGLLSLLLEEVMVYINEAVHIQERLTNHDLHVQSIESLGRVLRTETLMRELEIKLPGK